MSFSFEQKKEIISLPIKSICCRRALLSGIISSKGEIIGDKVVLSIPDLELCEYIKELINEVYSVDAEICSSSNGGRRKLLSFSSPSAIKYIRTFLDDGEFCRFKCVTCRAHYFKGVFLASGTLSDPEKRSCPGPPGSGFGAGFGGIPVFCGCLPNGLVQSRASPPAAAGIPATEKPGQKF